MENMSEDTNKGAQFFLYVQYIKQNITYGPFHNLHDTTMKSAKS